MGIIYRFYERIALNAYVSGDYSRAVRLFARMVRKWPGRAGVGHNLALAKLALKDYPGAEAGFLAELETYGPSFSRLRALADTYYAWGRPREAAERYKAAGELGRADKGPSRPRKEELTFAAERLALCLSEDAFALSRSAEDALEAGNAMMAAGRWDEAYASFESAGGADPTCFPAFNNLGVIAMNQRKDYMMAARWFRAAARLSSAPAVAQNLAQAEQLARGRGA